MIATTKNLYTEVSDTLIMIKAELTMNSKDQHLG